MSPPTPHAAEPIRVWRFDDAPEELRALSTNGGDEDWLAVLPTYLKDEYVGWLQSGTSFGCCRVEEIAYIYEGRSVCVAVGSHA